MTLAFERCWENEISGTVLALCFPLKSDIWSCLAVHTVLALCLLFKSFYAWCCFIAGSRRCDALHTNALHEIPRVGHLRRVRREVQQEPTERVRPRLEHARSHGKGENIFVLWGVADLVCVVLYEDVFVRFVTRDHLPHVLVRKGIISHLYLSNDRK